MATGMDTLGLYDLTSTSSNEKTSLLYSVLPRLVRTRLRRLPSLRRSFSQYTLDSTASTPSHSRRSSRLYSDLETPPPGYQSQVSLSEPVSDEEGDVDLPLRPLSSSSSDEPAESGSGIVWRFADQGLSLMNIALSEDKKAQRHSANLPTSLSRQVYVHGVTYVLRGLPTDLSSDEKLGIWSSMPAGVQKIAPIANTAIMAEPMAGAKKTSLLPAQAPMLQQAVASLVVQMFLLMQFLLPYVKYCVTVLYGYERQYRISERVIASSVQSCEGMLRTGLQVTTAISKMNDGKVGQTLNELGMWWVSGVTAGIHQGVGDGLTLLAEREQSINQRQR